MPSVHCSKFKHSFQKLYLKCKKSNKNYTIFRFRIPIYPTNALSGYHSKIQSSNIIITDDDDDDFTKKDDFSKDAIVDFTKKPSISHHVPPSSTAVPSFARKVKVIAFILGCCCLIAIIVNFINLHSDFEELQEFYIGYMGRKVLIQEQRLTSRTYLNLLRKAQREGIEVS